MYSDFFNNSRRLRRPNYLLSSNVIKDMKINVSPIRLDSIEQPILRPLIKRPEIATFKKIKLNEEVQAESITNFHPVKTESKSTSKGKDSVVLVDPTCVDTVIDFESENENTKEYQKRLFQGQKQF